MTGFKVTLNETREFSSKLVRSLQAAFAFRLESCAGLGHERLFSFESKQNGPVPYQTLRKYDENKILPKNNF